MFLYLCWGGTLLPLEKKFIRNIYRSKPCLFDTSTHSLITRPGRQSDSKQGF